MEITPKLVKELRDRSGVGMGKCKEALVEAEGDINKASDILRKKGLASAVKKEGRQTKEGVIDFFEDDKLIAFLEVNTETDFVAKNDKFKKFVKDLTKQISLTSSKTIDDLSKEVFIDDKSLTVDGYRNLIIQSLGENIQLSRMELIHKKPNASYGIYSHMGGKILTIVEITGSSNEQQLAKDIAMHVAAESPEYLKEQDIPTEVKRKEEEIARSQMAGKPENVIEKILIGKIKAFAAQVCLLNQKYVKDSSIDVNTLLKNKSKEIGKEITVGMFWRWKLGESL